MEENGSQSSATSVDSASEIGGGEQTGSGGAGDNCGGLGDGEGSTQIYQWEIRFSIDPNDKLAPAGSGDARFVAEESELNYQVRFENLPAALAPAQQVVVTDMLDDDLDLSTFQLHEIVFADQTIAVPPGLDRYEGAVPFTVEGVVIQVNLLAALDRDTRELKLTLQAIDPATGWLPEDPLIGFLFPNDATGRGEGSISYSVKPKTDLTSGTVIENRASIVFDYNDPILTPLVSNAIDTSLPSSSFAPLPAVTTTTEFVIDWSGEDEAGGSGVAGYDLYVSENGGPFSLFLAGTAETSMTILGEFGDTYAFYSVATDNVGHREATPTAAQATITIVNGRPELSAVDDDNLLTIAESTGPLVSATPVEVSLSATDVNTDQTLTFSLTVPPADDPACAGATLYDPNNADHTSLLEITLPSQTTTPGTTLGGNSTATGVLRIKAGPNAASGEPAKDWCFRILVSDGAGGTTFRTVRLTVNRTNSAPQDLSLSHSSVPENSAMGTLIGTLSTMDLDLEDTFSYVLLDNAGGRFQVSGVQLQVADGSLLDAAISTSHTIQVTATDLAGVSLTKSLVITVTPANELTVNLDVDDNGEADALTDGILILRYLFGFTGSTLTADAIGADAQRTDPDTIVLFLDDGLTTMLDVDDNGEPDALTDGILILRYLFGFTGSTLTADAIGSDAQRTDPDTIVTFLDGYLPSSGSGQGDSSLLVTLTSSPASTSHNQPEPRVLTEPESRPSEIPLTSDGTPVSEPTTRLAPASLTYVPAPPSAKATGHVDNDIDSEWDTDSLLFRRFAIRNDFADDIGSYAEPSALEPNGKRNGNRNVETPHKVVRDIHGDEPDLFLLDEPLDHIFQSHLAEVLDFSF